MRTLCVCPAFGLRLGWLTFVLPWCTIGANGTYALKLTNVIARLRKVGYGLDKMSVPIKLPDNLDPKKRRYRKLIPFQINLLNPDEYHIGQQIVQLKRERRFSKTVRDGIRLICDLRKGRVDVLQELFPWVLEKNSPDTIQEDNLQERFDRLEKLLSEKPQGVNNSFKPVASMDNLKSSTSSEPELEIYEAKHDADNNSAWNLMIASSISVYGEVDSLPARIIEYGLRTGRIPKHMIKEKKEPPKIKKIAGSDQDFAPPALDDLELNL